MRGIFRAICLGAFVLSSSCGPKATVTHTTPIARLQSYRTVLVRVGYNQNDPWAPTQVSALEWVAVNKLRNRCHFENIAMASQDASTGADLIMDLNIQRVFRGADPTQPGFKISNPAQATAVVAVMLSDGINDELLGSAQIRGKSSTVTTGSPEQQAIGVVADKVADMMRASGCIGPRIARDAPPPAPPLIATTPKTPPGEVEPLPSDAGPQKMPPPDSPDLPPPAQSAEELRAAAETLNDDGKKKFRQADPEGAAISFEEALKKHPDPRYQFNLCLALEAAGRVDDAIDACTKVERMGPDDRLATKARERLEYLQQKKSAPPDDDD